MERHAELPELVSSTLLDCHGAVTHRLTVLLDGTVRVRQGGVVALVDPSTRQVLPTGVRLPAQVIDHACSLAHELFR